MFCFVFFHVTDRYMKELLGLDCNNNNRFTLDIRKNAGGVSTAMDLPGERRVTSLEVSKDRLGKHLSELLRKQGTFMGAEVQAEVLLNKAQSSLISNTVIQSGGDACSAPRNQ